MELQTAQAAPLPVTVPIVDSYACRRCGQVLYRADEVLQTRPLWDLGEERNEVHVLRSATGLGALQRYDASLHEGWYCCRFALMRMVVDKFGTGDHLLAYVGDVVRVPAGETPKAQGDVRPGQTWVKAREFDDVLETDHGDHLAVVKFGATWCPPCRMVDAAISRLHAGGKLPAVRFYEADIDHEPELGERFGIRSLPTLRFWYRGQPLHVSGRRLASVEGALVGGIREQVLADVARAVLAEARTGQRHIVLP